MTKKALSKQLENLGIRLSAIVVTTITWVIIVYCSLAVPIHANEPTKLVHNTEIVGCSKNIHIKEAKLVGARVQADDTGYEWYVESYDTNKDGKADIIALSNILEMSGDHIVHGEHPLYYIVDFNGDGEPDALYIDKSGTGNCDSIELLNDLREQRPTTPDKDKPERGRASK